MLKYFRYIILLVCIQVACTKESVTNDASNGNGTGTGGSLAKFTIVGNYLYMVSNFSLNVYDISKTAPVQQSSEALTAFAETIFPFNDKLFIGSTTGMFIYSLKDPAKPALLSQVAHLRSCDPVVANDSIAFTTLTGNNCGPATDGLYINDIKNIANPVLIKTVEMPTPLGLGLNDSLLYICQRQNGLSVYNVSNPQQPILRTAIKDDYYNDVIVYGSLLICYIQTGLKLFDISQPATPKLLNTIAN